MGVFTKYLPTLSRHQKVALLPFVVTTLFFFLQPYPQNSFIGVIFKILPIISLVSYVIVTRSQFPGKTKTINAETIIPEDAYSVCVCFGLCLSAVGDVLVECPYTFIPGAIVFIVVLLSYYFAFSVDELRTKTGSSYMSLFMLLFINAWLCTQSTNDSYLMNIFVFIYYIPLFLLGWKTYTAMKEYQRDTSLLMAFVGASCFMLADVLVFAVLGECSCQFLELLIVITYYAGQCCWALSTSNLN